MTEDSGVAVSIVTPESFEPIKGKYNILYTMYECTTIPDNWKEPLQQADLIVVPCTHNKTLFQKYTKLPIEVCWEGVNLQQYTYKNRSKMSQDPFVFLWVGASNPRKGYEHVVIAWKLFTKRHPDWNCIMYMKTTQTTREERLVNVGGNAYIDTRYLPLVKEAGQDIPTMNELYHMAHAFLLPSMGEGFGLTLAEAMATGLPCIYTPWSGPTDFISHNEGFPVKWKFSTIRTKALRPETGEWRTVHKSQAASADIDSIVKQMERIYLEYGHALEKGKKAHQRIKRDITWDKSAKNFIKIVEKYTGERI